MPSHTKFDYGIKSTFSQCLALAEVIFVQMSIGIQWFSLSGNFITLLRYLEDGKNGSQHYTTRRLEGLVCFGMHLRCALSTLVLNQLGHKNCMIISNLPFIVSQLMIVYADDMSDLYASSVLIDLSFGFASVPFTAYVGEVCEPKLLGAIMSCMSIFCYLGWLLITTTFAITKQVKMTVLINLLISVLTVLILLVSPDSPMWLLTKGKTEKAKRTLGKLRGWVSYERCSSEFREMVVYTRNGQIIENDTADVIDGGDDESPWRQLLRPEVYRPFRLIMLYFFFTALTWLFITKEHIMFRLFGANIYMKWSYPLLTILNVFAGILSVFSVNKLGKRFITLFNLSICAFCFISIGIIGRFTTNPNEITSWLMVILYLISIFVSAFGIMPISWALLTEVFPMKSRHITCSIGSTLPYMLSFFMYIHFSDLLDVVDVYHLCTMFGIAGLFGFVFFYFYLPETENKTLQEISEFFK